MMNSEAATREDVEGVLDAGEARRIAEDLAAKYGHDALSFARARAAAALDVGDTLAYDAWQAILSLTREVLRPGPWQAA